MCSWAALVSRHNESTGKMNQLKPKKEISI
nr:hypothetical protein [Peribacillus butanolivorans]